MHLKQELIWSKLWNQSVSVAPVMSISQALSNEHILGYDGSGPSDVRLLVVLEEFFYL